MRYAKEATIVVCVWLVLFALLMFWTDIVGARGYESVGIKEAHAHVTIAKRDVAKAQVRLSKARSIESQTRAAVAAHGVNVGRWVWLARDVGWPAGTIPDLMRIIDRESGGSPKACNPSTASGLLQLLAIHWDGTGDYGWHFDPFNPRLNLTYGYKLYLIMGWSPWALTLTEGNDVGRSNQNYFFSLWQGRYR